MFRDKNLKGKNIKTISDEFNEGEVIEIEEPAETADDEEAEKAVEDEETNSDDDAFEAN